MFLLVCVCAAVGTSGGSRAVPAPDAAGERPVQPSRAAAPLPGSPARGIYAVGVFILLGFKFFLFKILTKHIFFKTIILLVLLA